MEPPVTTATADSVEGIIAGEDGASKQEEVQAGNEEQERKQKQIQERREKIKAQLKAKNGVITAAPQPGLQIASQPPPLVVSAMVQPPPLVASVMVTPSAPSYAANEPADPPAQNINRTTLTWTRAKPMNLLPPESYKEEIAKMIKTIDYGPRPGERPCFGQNREIREQQSDSSRTGARNKHVPEELSSCPDPVVPAPVASREQHTEQKEGEWSGVREGHGRQEGRAFWGNPMAPLSNQEYGHQGEMSSWGHPVAPLRAGSHNQNIEITLRGATGKQDDQEEGQLTAGVSGGQFDQFSRRDHWPTREEKGSENGYRPAASNDRRSDSIEGRHQINDRRYQLGDRQSRDYDRAPQRIESRSRDNDRGSEHSIGRSLEYDRSSQYSDGQSGDYKRGSEHIPSRSRDSSEHYRPRSNSQVDDRMDRRPAFGSMRNTRGRGRGLDMTKPAWMTRLEQQERQT
jgi:hypothetical protein